MLDQWIALFILVGAAVYIGYAIGVAKRKWWRGPKPPSEEPERPSTLAVVDLDDVTINSISDAVRAKLEERWPTTTIDMHQAVTAAIDAKLPGKAEFEASVAGMVRTAAEALQVARRKSGKRNRRGKA